MEAVSPSSYLGRSIIAGKKLCPGFIYLAAIVRSVTVITKILSSKDFGPNEIWFTFTDFTLIFIVTHLFWNHKYYSKFLGKCNILMSRNNQLTQQHSASNKKFAGIINVILLLARIIVFFYFTFSFRQSLLQQRGASLMVVEAILTTAFLVIWYIWSQFVVECCIYCRITFILIKHEISLLNPSSINCSQIRFIRWMYWVASEATFKLDSYFLMSIIGFYGSLIGHSYFIVAAIVQQSMAFPVFFFIEVITIGAYINYHLVSINYQSTVCYDGIYNLSFCSSDPLVGNEIKFFLTRVGRADAALSLGKLCLITPNFITTLVTIVLTIALAAPGFVVKDS